MKRTAILFWIAGFAAVTLAQPASARNKTIKVTTTVGQLQDLVKSVGGDDVDVINLMGPGVDPHLYKASASDITKLRGADVVFYVGLHLEGKLNDVLATLAKKNKHVYAVGDELETDKLIPVTGDNKLFDPHVWFDIPLWSSCIATVVKGLSAMQPKKKAAFAKRGEEVRQKLLELHDWAIKRLSVLPVEKRILITSHDAFNYFGRAYDFRVVGLQGISTVTEAGLADIAKMTDFIKDNKIKAIFVESSVSRKAIERVGRDSGAKVGGELFSDSMGVAGEIENGYDKGTYIGMVKHNVNTIVESLK